MLMTPCFSVKQTLTNWLILVGFDVVEKISGLRINLNKSELILVGSIVNVEELSATLGCKIGSLPTSYLGLRTNLFGFGIQWRRGFKKGWVL